jgi:NTP pyrophosphatase (non-canonical NTP hydrolase)
MSNTRQAIDALLAFRDEREWKQFHNPKDLTLALTVEASELLEVFLWKQPDQVDPDKVREELADVFAYAFLLAEHFGLDPVGIVLEKLRLNANKYPVEKAKGNATKYTELK